MTVSTPIVSATACGATALAAYLGSEGMNLFHSDPVLGAKLPVFIFSLYWFLGLVFSAFLLPFTDLFTGSFGSRSSLWLYVLPGVCVPTLISYGLVEIFAHGHGATHDAFSAAEIFEIVKNATCGVAAASAAWFVRRRRNFDDV